ncbi:hypothetical protein HG536_0F00870 [Torulaspora globosa]|uniref:Uncharacterized protein n=1 Tax=Torulaspora globosa TaxID=48254 RepID=A0A7G3ZJS6_9SACH|nr:uncharacterized protein HG536_0F00870 [Torulaspora globosa]QLL33762.1 hypothetical protein HG536_0F00870 [Torulaspora globosa]
MRRAFSRLSCQLLKRAESDELQSTIRFLARGSKPAISSLIDRSNGGEDVKGDPEEEAKHVERILKILNSTLPEVEPRKRHVEVHYDILFSQLKKIVESSIEATDREGTRQRVESNNVSESLYDELMLLQYTNKLTGAGQIAKIVLAKGFAEWSRVWDNISLFSENQRRDLSLLLYFRSGNSDIPQAFEEVWFRDYHRLHIITQRLLWRCVARKIDVGADFALAVKQQVDRVRHWTTKDLVVLYQSLFAKAHMLPQNLADDAEPALSRNQQLFIKTLRMLSPYESSERKIRKGMVRLVKLSIENKVASESPEITTGLSIYQYRFIRSLDLTVQELHSACEGKKQLERLRHSLASILATIHDEEQEVKSHMSVKFI